jgi:hypothetical protein
LDWGVEVVVVAMGERQEQMRYAGQYDVKVGNASGLIRMSIRTHSEEAPSVMNDTNVVGLSFARVRAL